MEIGHVAVPVGDSSAVSEARRAVAALARAAGLNETEAGRAAIVTTELGTNLLKHGGGGELLAGRFCDDTGAGLQLLALDKGAGITDIANCMRDGYSTAGSAGGGLGAIDRLSDAFDIASWPGKGTGILVRIHAGGGRAKAGRPGWGGVCLPLRGEPVSGDGWAAHRHEDKLSILLADGLGHGPLAAEAARAATGLFERIHALPLEELANRLHDALRPTRGAAIAVARLDPARRRVGYVGIGNIAGSVIAGGQARKMISLNGTAGHNARKIQAFRYDYAGRPLLVLHSDGLATSWALDRYPGLAMRHPALIAGILYRDFARGRDDVTVIVAGGGA